MILPATDAGKLALCEGLHRMLQDTEAQRSRAWEERQELVEALRVSEAERALLCEEIVRLRRALAARPAAVRECTWPGRIDQSLADLLGERLAQMGRQWHLGAVRPKCVIVDLHRGEEDES